MDQTELGSEALAFLATIFSHGTNIAQGVATRLLGDMVAKRLASSGHKHAWDEFKRHPEDSAAARPLLQQILREDPEFRTRLEDVLEAAMKENSDNSQTSGNIHITGSGQAHIGDRDSDHIVAGRVASRGSTYNEDNRVSNRTTNKKSNGSAVALALVGITVVAVLLILGITAVVHWAHGTSLNANSTCQQFLNASQAEQQQVIQSLATKYDKPDYVTPLGEPEVPYYCAANPSVTLGQFFAKAQD